MWYSLISCALEGSELMHLSFHSSHTSCKIKWKKVGAESWEIETKRERDLGKGRGERAWVK